MRRCSLGHRRHLSRMVGLGLLQPPPVKCNKSKVYGQRQGGMSCLLHTPKNGILSPKARQLSDDVSGKTGHCLDGDGRARS